MKKRNALKFISLVLSILMVLAVFASCSNNEENGENETSTDSGDNGAADNNDNVIDLDKLGDPGYRRPEYSDFIPLSRAAAAEGMVLLKNEDNVLPLDKNDKVTLVGSGSVNTVKGPSGTGSVKSANSYSLLAGMQIKEEEGKVAVNSDIAEAYANDRRYKAELEDMQKAKEDSNVAVFIITRSSKSGSDKNDQMGDYYLSSD
jgi:beta-glucosidase